MGVKILLADDSPTVHKVIKIILKDEPCEIVECSREAEMSDKIASVKPVVVFLDFNFSETKTGYELCRAIKAQAPQTKILVMYGTFDTVDESALRDAGAEQHVVKPFDTAKFIVQVRNLADGMASIPSPVAATPKEKPADEGWSIRETVERKTPDIGTLTNETVSSLNDDLNDWGMLVPGVIGKSAGSPDLPPIIGEEPAVEAKPEPKLPAKAPEISLTPPTAAVTPSGAQLPSDSDLEYPDMGDTSSLSLEFETTPSAEPKSKLVSLNELAPAEDNDDKLNSSQLLELSGMEDEGVKLIEDQIREEVAEDLWTVDAFEEGSPKLSVVKEEVETVEEEPEFTSSNEKSFGELMDGDNAFDESLFEPLDKQDKAPSYSQSSTPSQAANMRSSTTQLPADLNALRPLLQELVKEAVAEYCRQHVEKVAWEVIPDLAENLIKNELRKISDKVTRDL